MSVVLYFFRKKKQKPETNFLNKTFRSITLRTYQVEDELNFWDDRNISGDPVETAIKVEMRFMIIPLLLNEYIQRINILK